MLGLTICSKSTLTARCQCQLQHLKLNAQLLQHAWQYEAYQVLRGGTSPFDPELRIVAEWVGLIKPAVAASPLCIGEWLRRCYWPMVDPGQLEGMGQQGGAGREHLSDHHVCSKVLQKHPTCVSALVVCSNLHFDEQA